MSIRIENSNSLLSSNDNLRAKVTSANTEGTGSAQGAGRDAGKDTVREEQSEPTGMESITENNKAYLKTLSESAAPANVGSTEYRQSVIQGMSDEYIINLSNKSRDKILSLFT